jgi:hypothetical protein
MRTDISELHPDSDSTLRPPHDSSHTYSEQLGPLTNDQVKLSAKGEQFLRTEAEPSFAHVFSIHDAVSHPFRQGDAQR